MPDPPPGDPTVPSTIVRMHASGSVDTLTDRLAVEEPLEIRLGNVPYVVTMRTPGHDEELAAGFLVTEGIVTRPADLRDISRCPASPAPHNTIRVDLAPGRTAEGVHSARHAAIASSCGVCGKQSIASVHRCFPAIDSTITIGRAKLLGLPEVLRDSQAIFDQTGGLHSAGLFDLDGRLLVLREDIGRHNALDKVIGHAALNGPWPLDRHVLVLSGRVAFEIMQKALAARIAIVAAVSAPSSLAVSFALESGQTLVGFLRDPTFNIYAHPQRIT